MGAPYFTAVGGRSSMSNILGIEHKNLLRGFDEVREFVADQISLRAFVSIEVDECEILLTWQEKVQFVGHVVIA
uniref:Uncharacterized protein n=1 Tax=Oryza sativa subsp. japonica TaxID=39947 RepID=Q6H4Y0_ORYSJ|nr:hypothetical protein [Oryza sativa Japonica Group]BAD26219.1 hypothetical protein [Oryza sativa Japonica Group]